MIGIFHFKTHVCVCSSIVFGFFLLFSYFNLDDLLFGRIYVIVYVVVEREIE